MAEEKKLQEDCEEKETILAEETNEEITATEDKEEVAEVEAEEAEAEEAEVAEVEEAEVTEVKVAEVEEAVAEEAVAQENIGEVAQEETVQAETVATAKPKKACNKKRIIAIVAFVLVFAIIISIAAINTSSQNYAVEIEETSIELIVQTYTALTVAGTRLEYWDDAGSNNVLIDEAYADILTELEAGMDDMASAISSLKNPPSAYKEQYTYLSNMYEAYLTGVDLAINYGTDLETYFEVYQEVAEVFLENYTAISEIYFESEEVAEAE